MTADRASVEPAQDKPAQEFHLGPTISAVIAGAVFSWVSLGFVSVAANKDLNVLLNDYWWIAWVALIPPAIPLAIQLWPKQWWKGRLALALSTRALLFIFVVLTILFIVAGVLFKLPEPEIRAKVVRGIFLVIACILPAMMWYLFIVTRKASLLNEFLANLDRLGLLRQLDEEADTPTRRRIESYLQKFEAVYGYLPGTIHEDVLLNRFTSYTSAEATGGATLSTATYPVALFTILAAIGWLITLPPNELGSPDAYWVRALSPVTTAAPAALVPPNAPVQHCLGAGVCAGGWSGQPCVSWRVFFLAPDVVPPLRAKGPSKSRA